MANYKIFWNYIMQKPFVSAYLMGITAKSVMMLDKVKTNPGKMCSVDL